MHRAAYRIRVGNRQTAVAAALLKRAFINYVIGTAVFLGSLYKKALSFLAFITRRLERFVHCGLVQILYAIWFAQRSLVAMASAFAELARSLLSQSKSLLSPFVRIGRILVSFVWRSIIILSIIITILTVIALSYLALRGYFAVEKNPAAATFPEARVRHLAPAFTILGSILAAAGALIVTFRFRNTLFSFLAKFEIAPEWIRRYAFTHARWRIRQEARILLAAYRALEAPRTLTHIIAAQTQRLKKMWLYPQQRPSRKKAFKPVRFRRSFLAAVGTPIVTVRFHNALFSFLAKFEIAPELIRRYAFTHARWRIRQEARILLAAYRALEAPRTLKHIIAAQTQRLKKIRLYPQQRPSRKKAFRPVLFGISFLSIDMMTIVGLFSMLSLSIFTIVVISFDGVDPSKPRTPSLKDNAHVYEAEDKAENPSDNSAQKHTPVSGAPENLVPARTPSSSRSNYWKNRSVIVDEIYWKENSAFEMYGADGQIDLDRIQIDYEILCRAKTVVVPAASSASGAELWNLELSKIRARSVAKTISAYADRCGAQPTIIEVAFGESILWHDPQNSVRLMAFALSNEETIRSKSDAERIALNMMSQAQGELIDRRGILREPSVRVSPNLLEILATTPVNLNY